MNNPSCFVDDDNYPLDDLELQPCPKCNQLNLDDAVTCWSCSVLLNSEQMRRSQRKRQMRIRLENAADSIVRVLPSGASVLFVASGYARKGTWAFIAAGLAALGAYFGWMKRPPKLRMPEIEEEKPPVERLLNAIVLYAMRDGASKIRLRAGHGVVVHYLIGDKWKEQMRIPPSFAWIRIRVVLKERTGNWKQLIFFEIDEKAFGFMPQFEREFPLETLTLSLSL